MKLILLILCAISTATSQTEVTPSSWDLKTISHNSYHSKTFTLHNKSSKQLQLSLQPTGCNCIRYKLQNSQLLSGEKTTINVIVEPRGQHGNFNWKLKVKTNNEQNIEIPVAAKILKKYTVFPPQINLGSLKQGISSQETVIFVQPQINNFSVEKITSSNKTISAKFQQKTIEDLYPGPQKGYQIIVSLSNTAPVGRHSEHITIHTNNGNTFKVPIFFQITGELTTVPDYVMFGMLSQKKITTKRVVVYHNNSNKFKLTKINTKNSFVKTRIEEVVSEKYYYIYIDIDTTNAPRGEFRDVINITTNYSPQTNIPIYIHGFIR
ncbi:DUF1573 domain-containing protein [Candidatus Uabimicrobium sp. HlEnr_7]|uniref:DUF1573 domain-containing protein n=1 Tax=Candidatus Uabimicrobium helgolandensis TaxID=3095367 RepID=UPI003557E52C